MAVAIAGAVIAVAGIASGYSANKKAADKARKLSKLNAAFIRSETREQARRLQVTQKETVQQTLSATGASGVDPTIGSAKTYLEGLQQEQSRELAWLRAAGESRAQIARKGGSIQAGISDAQATSGALAGAGQVISSFSGRTSGSST